MKLVITIIAGVAFLGACSSESGPTNAEKAELLWNDVMSESQRGIFCKMHSEIKKDDFIEKLASEEGVSNEEAEAFYAIMNEEC
jgi:hypothetical protein